jgi:hypothetical protein
VDGEPADAAAIPLLNDGRTHDVQIVLGDQPQRQRRSHLHPDPAAVANSR